MAKQRVFISFDYDHDRDLRGNLVHQSRRPDSPFSMVDCSVQAPYDERWRQKVRGIIRGVDHVIVICGAHTDTAKGVAAEVTITQEVGRPYSLLQGRRSRPCTKPSTALRSDPMHEWTWDNLHQLLYARG